MNRRKVKKPKIRKQKPNRNLLRLLNKLLEVSRSKRTKKLGVGD